MFHRWQVNIFAISGILHETFNDWKVSSFWSAIHHCVNLLRIVSRNTLISLRSFQLRTLKTTLATIRSRDALFPALLMAISATIYLFLDITGFMFVCTIQNLLLRGTLITRSLNAFSFCKCLIFRNAPKSWCV